MATKHETVEWVTIDGVAYTTELEAILHDVEYAFGTAGFQGAIRPPEQRVEVAKQLLEFASRRSDDANGDLIAGVVAGFKEWR